MNYWRQSSRHQTFSFGYSNRDVLHGWSLSIYFKHRSLISSQDTHSPEFRDLRIVEILRCQHTMLYLVPTHFFCLILIHLLCLLCTLPSSLDTAILPTPSYSSPHPCSSVHPPSQPIYPLFSAYILPLYCKATGKRNFLFSSPLHTPRSIRIRSSI